VGRGRWAHPPEKAEPDIAGSSQDKAPFIAKDQPLFIKVSLVFDHMVKKYDLPMI